MSKGTPSFGRHQKVIHINCKRCGRHSYHMRKQRCSACGYPRAKMRKEMWRWKMTSRKTRRDIKSKHMKRKTARRGRS